jgi:carboxymethylenebutenolidase
METMKIALPKGECALRLYGDVQNSAHPIVFVFMDGFGPRPTLDRIGERLAGGGYRVILPDLFYAHAPYAPIAPQNLFSGGDDRVRLMTMLGGIDQTVLDGDVGGLLEFADSLPGREAPIGVTGYCMGGRYSLTAASLSPRVRAAACFHSSTLAPSEGDSAHVRLAGTAARVYIGTAGIDPTFDAAEAGRLAVALREAQVDYAIENYLGAMHGFVMDDLPIFSPAATERHWQRLEALFAETLI